MRTETRACDTRLTTACERCGCKVVIAANRQNRITYCADCIALMQYEKAAIRKTWINNGDYRVSFDPWDSWTRNSWLCRSEIVYYANQSWLAEGTKFVCRGEVFAIQQRKLIKIGC